ncbi:dihydrofolate reductase [Clostridium sp.]|uniref:dihydrofolate reductase n=1 Tax=Clostridium sp. TaxID=1506 RepID=UPI0026107CCC|nr:dihydrofolate reductase [Clostridium sp.]
MLSIIVAKANNNIIGGNNKLLWHLSKDLKRFKEITTGNTIIMGRKTFESLPKILPNRHHVVITSNKNFKVDSESVTIVNNIEEIVDKYKDSVEEAFVIGGGEIYNLLLPYTNKLYLTRVLNDFEGDTYFPNIDLSNWEVSYKSEVFSNEEEDLAYDFINLARK